MKTAELLARLQRHYIAPGDALPGGVFLPEVGWNGSTGSRCDALYVGFTSSSGRRLVGHELKVSRSDWRHELDSPGKADPWHDQCHAWFVVAPSEEIVPREEVPAGWGLMVPNSRSKVRMQVVVRPEYRKVNPSWNACRSLLARQDTLRSQAISAARADVARREREVERLENRVASAGERALSEEDRHLLEAARKLRDERGIDLRSWRGWREEGGAVTPEEFVAALRLVRAADRMSQQRARYVEEHLRNAATAMLGGLEEFTAASEALRNLAGRQR